MSRFRTFHAALTAVALFLPATVLSTQAAAQTPIEVSSETQFQIDLKVPDNVLKTFLPAGFTSSVATEGPPKDCNLRILFADRVTVDTPDGKPIGTGSQRVVYLAAPAKDPSGNLVQVVIGGLTDDPTNVPGPFGNYLLATTHEMRRTSTESASGPVIDTQDWVFTAATGEHLELHIKYEHGNGITRKTPTAKYYSAKDPSIYQISNQEMVLDILRNTTTNPPDRVKEFSLKMSGGKFDKLFDKTLKVLSWDNFVWVNRTVSKP